MNIRHLLAGTILVIGVLAPAADANACEFPQQVVVQAAPLLGDVYNQFANDGEERSSSYYASIVYQRGAIRAEAAIHQSAYLTENAGSGSLTVFPTLDGGTATIPFFQASESTSEVHIGHCTGIRSLNVGVGYAQTSTNYGYPHLRGLGVGLAHAGFLAHRIQLYGSLYFYPAMQGRYAVHAASSQHAGKMLLLTFALVTFDGGITWQIGDSSVSLTAGLYQELRYEHPYARSTLLIRASPYVGFAVGLRP